MKWGGIITILSLFLPISQVLAGGVVLPQKAGTFSIAPAKQEVKIRAGASKKIELRLANFLGQEQTFILQTKEVAAGDYSYQGFTLATSSGVYNFSQLIKFDLSEKIVRQGEEVIIPVVVSVPVDWPPQSVPGVILISPVQNSSSGNAKIKTSAGVFLLIRVDGEAYEDGKIEKFGLLNSDFVNLGQKIKLQIAYKNTGNVHLNPYGVVYLKNIFGQTISSSFIDPWFVLPKTIRLHEIILPPRWWPGIYQAVLNLNLGYQNKVVTETNYIFIVPNWWQTLIIVIILLLALKVVLKWKENKKNV